MDIDDEIDKCLKRLYQAKDFKLVARDAYATQIINNIDGAVGRTMVERDLITANGDYRMLTTFGIEVSQQGGWKNYLSRKIETERKEIESQTELQSLIKRQLELSIREMQVNFIQIRHWWLILIITILASAILSGWFQSLF